jgi:hypothetical protein
MTVAMLTTWHTQQHATLQLDQEPGPSSDARNQQHDNKAGLTERIALDQKVVLRHPAMSLGGCGSICRNVLRNSCQA